MPGFRLSILTSDWYATSAKASTMGTIIAVDAAFEMNIETKAVVSMKPNLKKHESVENASICVNFILKPKRKYLIYYFLSLNSVHWVARLKLERVMAL